MKERPADRIRDAVTEAEPPEREERKNSNREPRKPSQSAPHGSPLVGLHGSPNDCHSIVIAAHQKVKRDVMITCQSYCEERGVINSHGLPPGRVDRPGTKRTAN